MFHKLQVELSVKCQKKRKYRLAMAKIKRTPLFSASQTPFVLFSLASVNDLVFEFSSSSPTHAASLPEDPTTHSLTSGELGK